MKRIFLLFALITLTSLSFGQYNEVIYDEENDLHHIQIVQLDNDLLSPSKIISIKTPIVFTSFAFGWKIDQEISPKDILIHYRVHKLKQGWTEWKEDEAYISPNETRWQMYQTDLLFGLDEGVHDSIEFYYEIPDGVICTGVYLILQDLSPQLNQPIIRDDSEGIILPDRACPALPTMIPRSTWCGSYSACKNPTYTPTYISATHTVIHHGASPDSYTDGAAVVRSYWNYHVNTNGWSDIGYNYLFDKSGNMYVGRYNPSLPNKDVKAAHAGSANSKSIGLNYLGNSDASGTAPTTAQNNKCCQFMAWWYNYKGFDPTSSASILCQDNVTRTKPRICGHRDVNPGGTTCPGNTLYALLPSLRTNTKQIIQNCNTPTGPTNLTTTLLGCPDNKVKFSWQNSGTGWYIQVSTNSSFPQTNSYIKWVSGLTTYTGPDGFVLQSNGTTPLGSFASSTTYYWRIYYGNNNYTATKNFTTLNCNPPNVTVTANPSSICKGKSSTLTASGASTYSWSHSLGSGASKTVTPTTTTTYTVTGTGSNGVTKSVTVKVTVNPTPTVTASASPSTICSGASSVLTAGGASTYSWSGGLGTGSSKTVSPTSTTTYAVTGTSTAGCTGTKSVTVTVNPTPTVTASASSSTICSGSSSTLTAGGASTYSWSHSLGSGASKTVTPTTTTTYTVTGTSAEGCTGTKTVTVTVNPTPTVTASASPSTICSGSSSMLTAGGASTYSWSHSLGSGASKTVSPTTTTTYTVTGTSAEGCTGTKSVTVTVNPTPTVTASASPSTICSGASSVLTAGGANTYNWSTGENTDSITVTPTSTTTYTVTGTNAEGCYNTATVTITVNPSPSTPIISQIYENPIILFSSSISGNQWYLNDNPISGATDQTYIVNENGNYFTIVTIDGCSSLPSNQITINNVGINDYANDEILVYPNPAQYILYIQSSKPINEVMIINNLGQIVAHYSETGIIDINQLADGVYQIMIKTEDNIKVLPLIKK